MAVGAITTIQINVTTMAPRPPARASPPTVGGVAAAAFPLRTLAAAMDRDLTIVVDVPTAPTTAEGPPATTIVIIEDLHPLVVAPPAVAPRPPAETAMDHLLTAVVEAVPLLLTMATVDMAPAVDRTVDLLILIAATAVELPPSRPARAADTLLPLPVDATIPWGHPRTVHR